ncbi:MAG: holo-ACP synthase [Deltaproteobacteria bacterium]|nr:holo-ACP synthase [Deltaproteobacteria bacterium]
MIYGTGVDLIKIERMSGVVSRWGDRFLNRVFTAEEIRFCRGRPSPHEAFALRFAAKEAFSKALGLGMRQGVRWRDIEVFHDPAGKPGLKLSGVSWQICRSNDINGIHLSLSDDGAYGVAVVILET